MYCIEIDDCIVLFENLSGLEVEVILVEVGEVNI